MNKGLPEIKDIPRKMKVTGDLHTLDLVHLTSSGGSEQAHSNYIHYLEENLLQENGGTKLIT